MRKLLVLLLLFVCIQLHAQIGIGTSTPNASAKLDITATNKGLLIPRVALTGTTDASTISSPATGLLVFNTNTAIQGSSFVIPGFYYNGGTPSSPTWFLLAGYDQNAYIYNKLGFESDPAQAGAINIAGRGIFGDSVRTGKDISVNGIRLGRKNAASYLNLALGTKSLENLTTGQLNIGIGDSTLLSITSGYNNIGIGMSGLILNTTGHNNNAIGVLSMTKNSTGYHNIGLGTWSLRDNTSGYFNTSIGSNSMIYNTTGFENAVLGTGAARQNTTGSYNTGVGRFAIMGNTTGNYNTGLGNKALQANATGNYNLALGYAADVSVDGLENASAIGNGAIVSSSNTMQLGNTNVTLINTSGKYRSGAVTYPNTDGTSGQILSTDGAGTIGWTSLSGNFINNSTTQQTGNFNISGNGTIGGNATVNGSMTVSNGFTSAKDVGINGLTIGMGGGGLMYNTALGKNTLYSNTTGSDNTAVGHRALFLNTVGWDNTSVGYEAGRNSTGNNNTFLGSWSSISLTTGHNNTAIGKETNVTSGDLSNTTAIGYNAIVDESNKIQLGNGSVTKVNTSGVIYSNGSALTSDVRLKRNVVPIQQGLSIVAQLKPVHYEKKFSMSSNDYTKKEYGFIAQEVQKVIPDIITEGKDEHKTLSLDYNSIIAILTSAIQEQQVTIQQLKQSNTTQDAKIDALEKKLNQLTEKIAVKK